MGLPIKRDAVPLVAEVNRLLSGRVPVHIRGGSMLRPRKVAHLRRENTQSAEIDEVQASGVGDSYQLDSRVRVLDTLTVDVERRPCRGDRERAYAAVERDSRLGLVREADRLTRRVCPSNVVK